MSSHFWPWQYLGLIEEFLPRAGPRLQELLDIFCGPIGNSLKHYISFTFSRRSRPLSDFICKSWKCCCWHSRNLSFQQIVTRRHDVRRIFKQRMVEWLIGRWSLTFKIRFISLKNLYLTGPCQENHCLLYQQRLLVTISMGLCSSSNILSTCSHIVFPCIC